MITLYGFGAGFGRTNQPWTTSKRYPEAACHVRMSGSNARLVLRAFNEQHGVMWEGRPSTQPSHRPLLESDPAAIRPGERS